MVPAPAAETSLPIPTAATPSAAASSPMAIDSLPAEEILLPIATA